MGEPLHCGGAIICPGYVMTAGSCVYLYYPFEIEILVGINKVGDPGEQRRQVKKKIEHPEYPKFNYAILELSNPIIMRPETSPLYLPLPNEPDGPIGTTGMRFAVSGWGRTEDTVGISKNLQVASMYQEKWCTVTANEICLGGAYMCEGDKGGPAAWIDPTTSEVKLIGLMGDPHWKCSTNPKPHFNVFARISTVVNWINLNTKGCNQKVCSKGQCMTKKKLKPQARRIMERQPQ